jgi:ABC-2 type transport system ATP-binding protein
MRLEAVGKRYGLRQPWVVRDVTRDVAAGRLIRLEGPNGSGKSTLLRVMAGASTPSAGRVTGRPRAGYVPERFPGGLAFSAREYLTHLARIHGLTGPAVPAAVSEWLDRLGAAEYAAAPLRTLSKGMCQKVAIAQALLARPGLLVLDEAWTGLDQAARGALDTAVAERLSEGCTVLFVDHDPARLGGRVDERWSLAGGRVTVTGVDAGAGGVTAETGVGDRAGSATADVEESEAARQSRVIIEVLGLEARSLARVALLPGVESVLASSAGPDTPRADTGVLEVAVAANRSDDLLRELLAFAGVHVRSVRPGVKPPGLETRGLETRGLETRGLETRGPERPGSLP